MACKFVAMVLLCWLCFSGLPETGETAQCTPEADPKYLCTARCNGTSFDLSKAFDFPVKIIEPTARGANGETYSYVWNPCSLQQCPDYPEGSDIAVCQSANFHYSCGRMTKSIWLLDDWAQTNQDYPNWRVEYTFGTTWRVAIFEFIVVDKMDKPTVEFVSEEPGLQYNFRVKGRCIGQEFYKCDEYYKSRQNNHR